MSLAKARQTTLVIVVLLISIPSVRAQRFCTKTEIPGIFAEKNSPIKLERNLFEVNESTTGWIQLKNQSDKPIKGLVLVIKYETTAVSGPVWMTFAYGSERSNSNKEQAEFLPGKTKGLVATSPFILTVCPSTAKVEAEVVDFSDGTRSFHGSKDANQQIFPSSVSLSKIKKEELPDKDEVYALRLDVDGAGTVKSVSPQDASPSPPSGVVDTLRQWRFLIPSLANPTDMFQVSLVVRIDKTRCHLPHCPFLIDPRKLSSPFLILDIPTFNKDKGIGEEALLSGHPIGEMGEPRFVAPSPISQ
jgi:hypothetical protein